MWALFQWWSKIMSRVEDSLSSVQQTGIKKTHLTHSKNSVTKRRTRWLLGLSHDYKLAHGHTPRDLWGRLFFIVFLQLYRKCPTIVNFSLFIICNICWLQYGFTLIWSKKKPFFQILFYSCVFTIHYCSCMSTIHHFHRSVNFNGHRAKNSITDHCFMLNSVIVVMHD